jgi:hypothetical protein
MNGYIRSSTRAVMNLGREPLWRAAAVIALAWLVLASGLRAAVQDRRELFARESQQYRAQHFPDGRMPPKHGWKGTPPLSPIQSNAKETPGGVGYGYYFDNTALLWTNSTIADYYVVAPTYLGGNVETLYLTSTCRAQLGTESLIEYSGENEAQFWIYDWSQAATNPWQVTVDLPTDNPQYLTTRPDEFAVERQMVHVRNGTAYLGFSGGQYNWQNHVMLFDFARGDWDLVYSYNYGTTNMTNNIPTAAGESTGFWGPIVETFGTYTNVDTVGFDLIRLFQDGNANPFWLAPSNSYVEKSSPWNLLTYAPNTSFTVFVGSTNQSGESSNMGTLCVTADNNAASFSLNTSAGLVSPYWIITPNSNRWDNTVVGLPPGAYIITFNGVSGLAAPAPQAFNIISNEITTVQVTYGTTNPPPVGDSPIALTGYNRDVVVPNTATGGNTAPYAQPFDTINSLGFYEAGLDAINSQDGSATNEGLPQGGAFTSILDGVTTFQLGPYNGSNVLFMSQSSTTGALSLSVRQAYISLSVLASSANGGGAGSLVIHFTDGTSSSPISYNAPDWYNNLGTAITRFGSLYFGNYGQFYADNPSGNDPNLYQTTINLEVLGLAAKPIASVAFTMPGGADTYTTTGIFALSGTVSPVTQAVPLVAWTNPAPIIYGATLTINQLNATASVPGSFAYTPTNGAALDAGTNALAVIFTPADTVDYTSVTNTVSLVVARAALTVTAANTNRAYAQVNPEFTGTVVGLTNGDNITAAYSCSATASSPVGTYAIVPSLVDSGDRQTNYTVSLVNGTLTVIGPPVIQTATQSGNWFTFTWSALPTQMYQIQAAPNLSQIDWTNLGGTIAATNSTMTYSEAIGTNSGQFYRVVQLP